MKNICILGLGYIGLPTAAMFAKHDFNVIGVDIDDHVISTLNNGDIHIHEPGLRELVREALSIGNLRVATQPEPSDVFIIAVPTPFNPDKTADMRAVIAATKSIVPHLRRGNLVVLESTSPPLTTVDLVLPILERSGSGLKAGIDFYLAYSPERVLPGQILRELVENDRVIGGINLASAEAGRELYNTFVKGEIVLTNTTTAEMVKLMENTYRDVNIAIANEFSLVAEQVGINVWEAIELANHHPRVNILKPGPGVGGHCIAVDPWFIVQAAPEMTPLIQTARQVNDGMPSHVVELVKRALADIENSVIACLGLSYKADVDDTRQSPALEVVRRLVACGYEVRVYDPYVGALTIGGKLVSSPEDAVNGADCLVILTDHRAFKDLSIAHLGALMRHKYLIDTRNLGLDQHWIDNGSAVWPLGAVQRNESHSLSRIGR